MAIWRFSTDRISKTAMAFTDCEQNASTTSLQKVSNLLHCRRDMSRNQASPISLVERTVKGRWQMIISRRRRVSAHQLLSSTIPCGRDAS
jgi:hypothetical protein